MLNFRKLKQDFSSNIVKEGKELYDKQKVISAKLLHLDPKTMRVSAKVMGQYDNYYESEIEIDRSECETTDSDCDCPYNYDCQHLAAVLFYLEEHLDKILVAFSKENDVIQIAGKTGIDKEAKNKLMEQIKAAETKEVQRQEEHCQKQLLQEYVTSSQLLATSPFFRAQEKIEVDLAEFALIFAPIATLGAESKSIEIQMALRLPFRSKPLHIGQVKQFLEALRYEEPVFIGGKRYCFSLESFDGAQKEIVQMVRDHAICSDNPTSERSLRVAQLDVEVFGMILARAFELSSVPYAIHGFSPQEEDLPVLSGLYEGSWEMPLRFSPIAAHLRFSLEHIPPPISKILINPTILIGEQVLTLEEVRFFNCAKPSLLFRNGYYRFSDNISRLHLRNLKQIREMTIPEPLFGTFVENALPQITRFAEVANPQVIEGFVTIPFVGTVEATCDISYLDGELDAVLHFNYDAQKIPSVAEKLTVEDVTAFVTKDGVLARNLVEERQIIEDLFQDFLFNAETGVYIAKSEKKIVEFMADVIPRNQHRVHFNCPQNLLDQFIYDQTQFILNLRHTDRVDLYEIELIVDGALKGVRLDQLWECMGSKKAFIELDPPKARVKKGDAESGRLSKILVLDLNRLNGVVQLFDEMGIDLLDDHTMQRPLWSLANIDASHFEGLPVTFSMSEQLMDIRKQMLGEKSLVFSDVPKEVKATLRAYQTEGVHWLERLRSMFLNGILADDMGLGKTLQAIVALTQLLKTKKGPTLIVCPTSLLYNWKEEFAKFNPKIQVKVVDGVPSNRKRVIDQIEQCDVLVTSYTLLQKDIELYKLQRFIYVILDEAQHIKNRGTRNARSVKQVQAEHRLILSGTPIENSLDELWSLFDFLMPSFLSTYERFIEKYIRVSGKEQVKNIEYLRKKVAPFILRRMKSDVLDDLPPISEIIYHCQLSDVQLELYRSYAQSARDQLVKLVEKEGFDRVQIHVLATLTRLKQICCHPAIFAKEKAEVGDSSKYDMLIELVQTLIEGNHKTVIFSQYTRMLQIMREDFEQRGIPFVYLDGSSKNRLEVVKQFNETASIPVFLVSLKAGGTGLNLVGADTVIHYDMWWNPAVESQATDRVHRMGQKKSVSAYKLITLGTIEEKIAEMQKKKKGLVKKVVSCDDEVIAKLTWEDVLELLKT